MFLVDSGARFWWHTTSQALVDNTPGTLEAQIRDITVMKIQTPLDMTRPFLSPLPTTPLNSELIHGHPSML